VQQATYQLQRLSFAILGMTLSCALLTLPIEGFAQSTGSVEPPPRPAAGVGVRVGDIAKNRGLRSGSFLLRPSIQIDGHYDSNVFNGNDDESGNLPQAGTSLRLSPQIALDNGTDSEIQFRLNALGDIRLYLSDQANLKSLNAFGGSADLNVDFAARRAISFSVFNNFSRSLRPNNWQTTATLNRISNQIGGRVAFHPGDVPERRPLEINLQAAYSVDRFEDFQFGDSDMIRTRLNGSWRFLPRTAAIVDVRWDFRSFLDGSNPFTTNSSPWRVQTGLAGALTNRVTFRLTGGWGDSSHDSGSSFDSAIGQVSLGYAPSATTFLSVGYSRDFQQAYYGNFIDANKGTVTLQQQLGSLMTLHAWFAFTYGIYGEFRDIPANTKVTQANRKDYILDGGLRGQIEFTRLVGMTVGYTVRGVLTNFRIESTQSDKVLDVGAYVAHEIFAGLALRY